MIRKTLFSLSLFSLSFALVEAAVVIYLRSLYYPEGFAFPLKLISAEHLTVELAREFATIVMLATAGMLAGKTRWQKFAYFMIAFGVWDIFYYVWLKVAINWPASLFEWDILFLIPMPWIGPVIAPILISTLMIVAGHLILRWEESGVSFQPPRSAWILSIVGSAIILYSFMHDVEAEVRGALPEPYRYELLAAGLLCFIAAMVVTFRRGSDLLGGTPSR